MALKIKENTSFTLNFKPHHFGVSVANLETALEWYEKVLGFKLINRFQVDSVPFIAAFMTREGFNVELFEVKDAAPLPAGRRVPNDDIRTHGNKHMAFEVTNIHEIFEHFKQQGVDIAWDVFPMGDEFGGFIRDDTGNLIEFVQL